MDYEKEKQLNPNLEPWMVYLVLQYISLKRIIPKDVISQIECIVGKEEDKESGEFK